MVMQKIIITKNNIKKTNKLLNHLINYTEKNSKSMYLIKVNLKLYVINLLSTWIKQKINFVYKHEHKNKIKSF